MQPIYRKENWPLNCELRPSEYNSILNNCGIKRSSGMGQKLFLGWVVS